MKNDTTSTSLRLFLALIFMLFLTLFVFVYIEALKFEENIAQDILNEQFELTQQEEHEETSDYSIPSEPKNNTATQFNVQTLAHTTVEQVSYSQYELELLAHLIQAEANIYLDENGKWQYCSDEWQCYVACVAMNRVESSDPGFPDTLEEVIFQEGQ